MSAPMPQSKAALRALYQYWTERRGRRAMPAIAEINMADLRPLLPNLMLIDVEEGPRFRYRMLGSELVGRFGRDPTGEYADEVLEGNHKRFVTDLYAGVARSRQPALAESEYKSRNAVEFSCRRIVLPLSGGLDERVSRLLGMQVFEPGKPFQTKIQFHDAGVRDSRASGVDSVLSAL